jgi:hypothetical protein
VRGRGEVYTGFWCGTLREIAHLEDPGVYWRIILRWVFRKRDRGAWTGMIRLGRAVAGTCECGNEPTGSIKYGEFLDWLRTG